jgi:hypothetical protein
MCLVQRREAREVAPADFRDEPAEFAFVVVFSSASTSWHNPPADVGVHLGVRNP